MGASTWLDAAFVPTLVQGGGTPYPTRPSINFIGATVAVADDAGNARTNITITSGGGGGITTVQANGGVEPAEPSINFIGFTVTDDPGNTRTNVELPTSIFSALGNGSTDITIPDSDYTLSGDDAAFRRLVYNGTLTANRVLTYPASTPAQGNYYERIIDNQTAHYLSPIPANNSGSITIGIPPGYQCVIGITLDRCILVTVPTNVIGSYP